MEQAKANRVERLAQMAHPEPEPQREAPTLSDMPDDVMRKIVIAAVSAPRPTQYWHIPMLRDMARLAPTNRQIGSIANDLSNRFPIRRTVLEFHDNPRALAAIERAQNTRIRRPHLADDAGGPWMPVRAGIHFQPGDRIVDRRGRDIDRGR